MEKNQLQSRFLHLMGKKKRQEGFSLEILSYIPRVHDYIRTPHLCVYVSKPVEYSYVSRYGNERMSQSLGQRRS